MKKKLLCITLIIISFILMSSSISKTELTIKNAQERIVEKNFNELPEENVVFEEGPEEVIEEQEKTNEFNSNELTTIIISISLIVTSFITIIFVTMILFNGIKNPLSLKVSIPYTILIILLSEIAIITTIIKTDKEYINGAIFEKELLKKENALSVIKTETTEDKKELTSTKKDETVLKITNEASYNGININLNKISGSSNTKENEETGINNVLLVNKKAQALLKDSTITSNNKNSSAIYTINQGTLLTLDNVNVTTTKDNSKAIINKDNSEIKVNDSTLNTSGLNSELIYTNSNITATSIIGSTNSKFVTMKEYANLIISKSSLTSLLKEETKGLFTIESTNTNNSYDTSELTLEDNKINITSQDYDKTPLFYVYNSNSRINLTSNNINYKSDTLLTVTSEQNSSYKTTTFTATDSTIKGKIIVDKNSASRINLNNTKFTGSINKYNESQNVYVALDRTSIWYLTGDSYIDTLTFQRYTSVKNNIRSNGYNIYCNSQNNPWLNGKITTLPGGGKIIPV